MGRGVKLVVSIALFCLFLFLLLFFIFNPSNPSYLISNYGSYADYLCIQYKICYTQPNQNGLLLIPPNFLEITKNDILNSNYVTVGVYGASELGYDGIQKTQERTVFLSTNSSVLIVRIPYVNAGYNFKPENFRAKDAYRDNLTIISTDKGSSGFSEDVKLDQMVIPNFGYYFFEFNYDDKNAIAENSTTHIREFYKIFANSEPANFYNIIVRIPKKADFYGIPILTLTVLSTEPNPDSKYETKDYIEFTWKSEKKDFKTKFIQPTDIKYKYDFPYYLLVLLGAISLLTALFYIFIEKLFGNLISIIGNFARNIKIRWQRYLCYLLIILCVIFILFIAIVGLIITSPS